MKNFSQKQNQITSYIFSTLNEIKRKYEEATGKKVVDLTAGSPSFAPSKIYIEKLKECLCENNAHRYPGYEPINELKDSIKSWYQKRFGIDIQQNEIMHTLGAKDAIAHLPLMLLDPKDEAMVPDPGYTGYVAPIVLAGGQPVFYNLKPQNKFDVDIEEIERKVTKKTKFIWVNSPSNPLGNTVSKNALQKLINLAKQKDFWILYDNAYADIYFDGNKPISIFEIEGAKECCIEIYSLSKTFSFAGFRIGFIVGNDEFIKEFKKLKSQIDSGMTLAFQRLASFALTNFDEGWYSDMIENYKQSRDEVVSLLKPLELEFDLSEYGFYIWAKIATEESSMDYVERILNVKGILLVPGSAYGQSGEGFVRASFCNI